MPTLVDLQPLSMHATATSSWTFLGKLYMGAKATSSSLMDLSVARSGGPLERNLQMKSSPALSSSTLLLNATQAMHASMVATSTGSMTAADTGVSRLAPLTAFSSDRPYAAASGSFSPLTSESSGPLPPAYYSYATSGLAPLLDNGNILVGSIGQGTSLLRPLAGLSGDYPYAAGRSEMQPLTAFGNDPGPGTPGIIDAYMSELVYVLEDMAVASDYTTAIEETVTLEDTLTPSRLVIADIEELVQLDISLSAAATYLIGIAETIQIHGDLERDEAYVAWVLNTSTNANSKYAGGFQFDSMIKFNGRFIGAGPDGLFELTGDSDNGAPIVASVLLDTTDFDNTFKKQLDGIYLGVESHGDLHVKLHTDDGRARTYRAVPTGTMRTRFVQPGKGLFSRYYQAEITNPDGADFALDVTELVPISTKRRR